MKLIYEYRDDESTYYNKKMADSRNRVPFVVLTGLPKTTFIYSAHAFSMATNRSDDVTVEIYVVTVFICLPP